MATHQAGKEIAFLEEVGDRGAIYDLFEQFMLSETKIKCPTAQESFP